MGGPLAAIVMGLQLTEEGPVLELELIDTSGELDVPIVHLLKQQDVALINV